MDLTNPFFWQSLTFSLAAVAVVVLSAWWLYFSPLKGGRGPTNARPEAEPSPRLAGTLALLLGLSGIQLVAGAYWDASMHILTGQIPAGADFLWPPHLMIYSAFLLSFVVAGVAMALVAGAGRRAGQSDPRLWLRRNPYLGAVALASAYSLLSIPGDALWHALYGIDLTAWSPPHVILGITSCTVIVCALGLLAQARPAWADLATLALLGVMLSVAYLIGVIEWELPGAANPLVAARPIWLYPLVGGALAFFSLLLARRLLAGANSLAARWAATLTAGGFYLVRLGISAGLALTGNVVPYMPLWFILGAVLLDVLPWQRIGASLQRDLATAGAFTLGYALLALPALQGRAGLPAFSGTDLAMTVLATLAACLLLLPVVRAASSGLRGAPPQPRLARE